MSDDKKDKDVKSNDKVDVKGKEPTTRPPILAEKAAEKNADKVSSQKNETPTGNKPVTNKDKKAADSKVNEEVTRAPTFDAPKMPKLSRPKASKKRNGLLWFVLALLVLVIGGIGWSTYQQYLMQQNWQTLRSEMTERSANQAQNVSSAKEDAQQSLQVSSQNSRQVMQQAQLIQQLRQALTATQERVRELSGRQQQDWLLAEAEYLIKLAEYKITLEKDKRTAIGLLKTADQRLMEIADNSLLDLRQILAQDIGNLQLVIAPDVGGISSQLNAVGKQVEALELKALEFEEVKPILEENPSGEEAFSWKKVYRDFLDDFVTIKDHSEPVKPLMTPEQRGNLNANIQLALQKAQIALVRSEQQLYENSLEEALTWVETFFVTNNASEAVITNLKALAQQRVVIDLPKSLESKNAIQAVNQQRLYQWLNEKPTNSNNVDTLMDTRIEDGQ